MIRETATSFPVPIEACSVCRPRVIFDSQEAWIYFRTEDQSYCRTTFENFDAIKICSGEHFPYDHTHDEEESFEWVFKIENSCWLAERYNYEKKYYKNAYGFGGNVEEMLSDFSHYLFTFHDEFVEVLASGVWFEFSDEPFSNDQKSINHPSMPLTDYETSYIKSYGHICQVRKGLVSTERLIENARYHSQPIMEFIIEKDGQPSNQRKLLSSRYRNDRLCSILTECFLGELAVFEGVANLEDTLPSIDNWLSYLK